MDEHESDRDDEDTEGKYDKYIERILDLLSLF
jgi:hypothetical protein